MCELSIVTPIHNEEASIDELYRRLKSAAEKITSDYELIFVNDGSKDNSLQLLMHLAKQDANVKYISFSRNFGHQIAITAGLDFSKGNAVIIIDGDLQDPPELISELYKKYKEGYKVVYARRIARKGESIFKKISAFIFYRLFKIIIRIDIPIDTGDFRLIDRKVVEQLTNMPERSKFLRGQISWIGFKQTYIEYERDVRKYGQTGFNLKRMTQFAFDGITGFSDAPLKLALWIGFAISVISFIIILYALYSKFVLKSVITGWTSLIISSAFIGGIQLLMLGIIGEYISRINTEIKKRPLYIVDESNI